MRISRDQMLMRIARTVAERGTCNRASVGCVIVREGRILSMGYVGSPPGAPHCHDAGCIIDKVTGGCIRTQHAEANAIAWAARCGIAIEGASLYVTLSPCLPCAKMILTAGIQAVYFAEPYRDTSGLDYLSDALLDVRLLRE